MFCFVLTLNHDHVWSLHADLVSKKLVAAHCHWLPPHTCADISDLDVKTGSVLYTAVSKQHRHIRVVKRGISFSNSLNLLGFKGLTQHCSKNSRFCNDWYLQPFPKLLLLLKKSTIQNTLSGAMKIKPSSLSWFSRIREDYLVIQVWPSKSNYSITKCKYISH